MNRWVFFHAIVNRKRDPGSLQDTGGLLRHAGFDEAPIGDDESLRLRAFGEKLRDFRDAAAADKKTCGGMEGEAVLIRHNACSCNDDKKRGCRFTIYALSQIRTSRFSNPSGKAAISDQFSAVSLNQKPNQSGRAAISSQFSAFSLKQER